MFSKTLSLFQMFLFVFVRWLILESEKVAVAYFL